MVDANNTSTGYNITLEDILSISCNCTTDDASTTLPMQYIQCEYSGLKEDAGFSLEVLHYHGSIEQPVLMQTVWDQKKLESVGKDFDNRVLYNLNTETQDAWYKVPLNTSGAWYCVKLRQGSTLVESSVCKRKGKFLLTNTVSLCASAVLHKHKHLFYRLKGLKTFH